MAVAAPPHKLLARHPLPLRWLRLPLLLATVGLSCMCIAVGVQALDRSSKLEKSIREIAEETGSTIDFDMNDIKATTIVLTLLGFLLAIVSSVFFISLASDFITHLRSRPDMTTTAKERDVEDGDEEKAQSEIVPRPPFSTRTLRFQAITLSFLSVWLLAVLIPSTVFSRTGSAHLTVQNSFLQSMVFIDPVYWDYGFLRCLAAAPWFSLVFSAPASMVTWVAWQKDNLYSLMKR